MISVSRTVLLISAALAGIAAVYLLRTPAQQADPEFDTRVARPAYTTDHPRVHFLEDWSQGLYQPLLDLIRNDGYVVVRHKRRLTREGLKGADVLILTIAMGFTLVKNWVDTRGASACFGLRANCEIR